MRKILSVFICLIVFSVTKAQIVINEYSCSNINTTLDAYNESSDWVELYNAGAGAINLTGYYLSDNPSNPLKWQIPATVGNTPAGGRRRVFCSGRGVINGVQIHPSFKLTQTQNEWFLISDPSGVLIDSVQLRLTQAGHSWGRTTDGAATWSLFTTPTHNASNAGSTPYTRYALKPTFNIAPGFYSTTQNIILTTTEPNVTIRYTLNGTVPTAASTAYTGPISVAATTAIRAKAFSNDPTIVPSFTETNTYLINESTTFNVISVTGPYATNLFTWASQPITTSFEYFDKNQNFILEYEGRAQRHGHDSWAYPQKGFKVYAQDDYGYVNTMEHKFFNTSLRDEFDMLIIKAAGSDNYPGGPTRATHMRDMFAHTLAEKYGLEMDFRRYTPTIVFVNGQYWGVYEIRERVDKDYFDYYYGVEEKDADNLRYWGGLIVGPGTAANWNTLVNFIFNNTMTNTANYNFVEDSLNVKSLAQYFIFNQYLVNTDWLNWNTQWWRGRGSNSVKWRYALWDEDNILNLGQNYTGVGNTSYENDPCDPISLFPGSPSIPHSTMLDSLLKSPIFKTMYDQQWIDMLNGVFKCENILAHYDSVAAILQPEMQRQINRWGGSMTDWQNNIAYARNQIAMRCAVISGKLDTCLNLYPQELILNVDPPNSGTIALDGSTKSPYIWRKIIEGDSIYTLQATPNPGYWAFDYWEKKEAGNTFSPSTTSNTVQYDFNKKDSVVAHFKYFNYDSIDVTFDVTPPGTGVILLNGATLTGYPVTLTLDRRFQYQIEAVPNLNHIFLNWNKNNGTTTITPTLTSKQAYLNFKETENIVANFEFVPPPPPPIPPPPVPELSSVDQQVFIPNVFSPNGDGTNDIFGIRTGKDVVGVEISIFDRWGKLVFQTNDPTLGWNGTYSGGTLADVGTYKYYVKVRFRDQSIKSYQGDLTLLR